LQLNQKLDAVSQRQLFSSVGQVKLLNYYHNAFQKHNLSCGQVLTTKESLSTRRAYLNQRNCLEVMLKNGVIPIINENDTISITELMFTDNDELSGLISGMMQAEILIILSNIDGIFNGDPSKEGSQVIREVLPEEGDLSSYINPTRSSFGRGGMITKCTTARKVAEEGIPVIIANGKKENILIDVLGDRNTLCTRFLPSKRPMSGVKKWISSSESFAQGEIYINAKAEEALRSSMAISLLYVGVVRIEGDFEKGDLVRILSLEGRTLGVGCASHSSKKAKEKIGKKGEKPCIHYDYLYLD